MNEPKITTAHAHCKKLEKIFDDWLHNEINNQTFSAKAAIEIEGLTNTLNNLISKSME